MDDFQKAEDALVELVSMLDWLRRVTAPDSRGLTFPQSTNSNLIAATLAQRHWPEFREWRRKAHEAIEPVRPFLKGGPLAEHIQTAASYSELTIQLAFSAGTLFELAPPDPEQLEIFNRQADDTHESISGLNAEKLTAAVCSELREARRWAADHPDKMRTKSNVRKKKPQNSKRLIFCRKRLSQNMAWPEIEQEWEAETSEGLSTGSLQRWYSRADK